MNRKVIITLIAFLLAANVASAQVTFGSSAPVEGQTSWDETATYATTLNATAGQSTSSAVTHQVTASKKCTLLELDGAGRMDSVRVTYDSASNAAVAGKSYVVTPQGVSGAATEEEERFVRDDNASFSQFRAFDRIFAGETFQVGVSVQPNKHDAEDLVNVAEGTRLRNLALTLRSVQNGVARFDISMTLESDPKEKKSGKAAGGGMTLTLDGELDVTVATSRPVRLDVSGNLQASTRKTDGSRIGDATGSALMRRTYAF